MKERYEELVMEVVSIKREDVIVASDWGEEDPMD